MRLAVSQNSKNFGEPKIVTTPKDFYSGMRLFEKVANELARGKKIKAIAGGIAGPLDRKKTKLVNSPNISGWINKPLKDTLRKIANTPVFLENDAAMVGLGEAVFGAGKGEKIVAYITVSTGVGGTRIVNGEIDQNTYGFEPGHQIIDPVGILCSVCGTPGRLEGYVSGMAFEHRYHKKPRKVTDPEVWEQEAKWLAYGLNNTIVHWSPDIVVLGGSMITKKPGISIKRVHHHLKKILLIFPELPRLAKAELGDVGGFYGALVLLKQKLS